MFCEDALSPAPGVGDALLDAAMKDMAESSQKRMQTMARVHGVFGKDKDEKRLQRNQQSMEEQIKAVREEHAQDLADELSRWYNDYSKAEKNKTAYTVSHS